MRQIPSRVGEEVQRSLALVVMGPQLGRAKEDVEIVFERGSALHLDAQRSRDRAVTAAAGDEVVGGNLLPLAGHEIMHGRDHAGVVLLERLEPAMRAASVTLGKLVARSRRIGSSQSWLQRCGRSGLIGARRPPAVTGPLDARDLEAGQRGEIEHGVRIVLRRAGLAHLVRDPPAPEELHGAGVLGIGAGMRDGAVALLHERGTRCRASRDRRRGRGPTGPPPTINTGCVDFIRHRLFSMPSIRMSSRTR